MKFNGNFQTRNASIKNSLTMVQRPAPYHKLNQELTKIEEKDENNYGTFSP